MVTTRSQDRIDASSPAPINKRRRFSSEEHNGSIVVEVPLREAEDIKNHATSIEIESDDDAPPEVISSKDTAQQVRTLPNRSLGSTGNKRRKVTKEIFEDGVLRSTDPASDASQAKEQNSADSNAIEQTTPSSIQPPAPSVETPVDTLLVTQREPAAAETEILQIEDSKSTASGAPAELIDLTGDVPAQTDLKSSPAESQEEIASEGNQDNTPATEGAAAVTTAPTISNADAAASTHLHLDLAAESPPNATEDLDMSTPPQDTLPLVEQHTTVPATVGELSNTETPQLVSPDIPMSQPIEIDLTSISPPVETNAPGEQIEPATTPSKDPVPETPQSTTSGIITPVWQTRTDDMVTSSADTKPKRVDPSRSRPRQKLNFHHQQMPDSKPKPASLQQYRDRLLNRHPRTATWGPPGFRNTRFVGA
ncbi:hypothetical protein H2200_006652 [Cladophialophora chaetospira]|uniref:Uncharacterized protein n=1 Tax=Cladophialophora chaetospira TaxID=386627 RepID=A0AA38X8L4_9EURO|nr:hypothetical protein H2200_006652 [Cladophialophora chaetospira]